MKESLRIAMRAALPLVLFVVAAFACHPALSMTPPQADMVEEYRADGTLAQREAFAHEMGNDRISPELIQSLRQRLASLAAGGSGRVAGKPPTGWEGLPTTGTVKIPVICIRFNDYTNYNFIDTIKGAMFNKGKVTRFPYESLQEFYRRSSFNKLTITGDVYGWTDMNMNRPTSGGAATREDMIFKAFEYWENKGVDFSQYDNNGDGKIDFFIVIWTGPHTGWASFWWAYQTVIREYPDKKVSGKTVGTYVWMPESLYKSTDSAKEFEPTVAIHETGHALGLPDYYDYDDSVGPNGGLGGLDMMDGNWGDHNGFSKFLLDWLTPTVYNGGYAAGVTLRSTDLYPDVAIVMPDAVPGQAFGEFFLVQNRNQTGNDTRHPGKGLMIYHIDSRLNNTGSDYLYDNSYTSHKMIRTMEADGLEEIETGSGYDAYADSGDYWGPITKTFSSTSMPNSKRYTGGDSSVTISNISGPGESMTFDIGVSDFTAIRATAMSATNVVVEFNKDVDLVSAAVASSYSVPGFPIQSVEVMTSNKVSITLTSLWPNSEYTLYISSSVRSSDDKPLYQGNMPLKFTYTTGAASLCYSKQRCAVISSCKDVTMMSDCSPLQMLDTTGGYPASGTGYPKNPFEGARICLLDETGNQIGDCAETMTDGNFALFVDTYVHPLTTDAKYNIAMIVPSADATGVPCHKSELPASFYGADCGVLVAKKVALKQDSTPYQVKISPVADASGGGAPSGNLNCDTTINLQDFTILKSNFGKRVGQGAEAYADINGDGFVNLFDFTLLKANFNKKLAQTPPVVPNLCKP